MKRFVFPLVLLAVLSIIFGTMYVSQQQILRANANDPQVQIAHDSAAFLQTGADPQRLINSESSQDMNTRQAPFIIVYNKDAKPVVSSVRVNNVIPQIPRGVLFAADHKYDNRVTWQPNPDVRIASVTVATSKYYVVVGRSIREPENRVQLLGLLTFAGWFASVAVASVWLLMRKRFALK